MFRLAAVTVEPKDIGNLMKVNLRQNLAVEPHQWLAWRDITVLRTAFPVSPGRIITKRRLQGNKKM